MQGGPVRLRVDSNRRDTCFPAGALDTYRDLAAIGDQQSSQHEIAMPRLSPFCLTRSPSAARYDTDRDHSAYWPDLRSSYDLAPGVLWPATGSPMTAPAAM